MDASDKDGLEFDKKEEKLLVEPEKLNPLFKEDKKDDLIHKEVSERKLVTEDSRDQVSEIPAEYKAKLTDTIREYATTFLTEWEKETQDIKLVTFGDNHLKVDLCGSAVVMRDLCARSEAGEDISAETFISALKALLTAAESYCDTHRGTVFEASSKSARFGNLIAMGKIHNVQKDAAENGYGHKSKRIALQFRTDARNVLKKLYLITGQKDADARIESDSKEDLTVHVNNEDKLSEQDLIKERYSLASSKMSEFSGMYKNWKKYLGAQNGTMTSDELMQEKINFFRPYEKYILYYRDNYTPGSVVKFFSFLRLTDTSMNSFYREIIEDYEECMMWQTVNKWQKDKGLISKKKEAEETIGDMVQKSVELEDDQDHYEKMKPEEVDKDLSPEQLKGIEKIDHWIIRNFRNGGVLGKIIPPLKSNHSDLVNAIFNMTKRERLHMYYLVETDARKNPSTLDVGVSQVVYIPNLDAFKGKMLATKWKFISHMTGAYVYMHKLSDAYLKTKEYSEAIKSTAGINKMVDAGTVAEKRGMDPNSPVVKRSVALRDAFTSMKGFRDTVQAAMKEKNSKKKAVMEEEARMMAEEARARLNTLVELDDEVAKLAKEAEVLNEDKERTSKHRTKRYDANAEFQTYTKVGKVALGTVPGAVASVIEGTRGVFEWSWGLSEAGFKNMELFTGGLSSSFSAAGNVLSLFMSINTLETTGASMSKEQWRATTLDIVKNVTETGLNIARGVYKITHLADYTTKFVHVGEDVAKTAAESVRISATTSPVLYGLGIASASINAGVSYYQWKDIYKRSAASKKAHLHFDKEKEDAEEAMKQLDKSKMDEEALNERKRLKFESGMMKLSDSKKTKDTSSAILQTINTVGSITGVAVPGIGVFFSMGAMIGTLIAGKIIDKTLGKNLRNALFDHYFNMDNFTEEVWKKKHEEKYKSVFGQEMGQNTVKQNIIKEMKAKLRGRVAAAAGFATLEGACTHVAEKYAAFVRERLFGQAKILKGSDEFNGYMNLIKSLGLKYDENKQLPTEYALIQKFTIS